MPLLDVRDWTWEEWAAARRKAEPSRLPYTLDIIERAVRHAAAANLRLDKVATKLQIPILVIEDMARDRTRPDSERDEIEALARNWAGYVSFGARSPSYLTQEDPEHGRYAWQLDRIHNILDRIGSPRAPVTEAVRRQTDRLLRKERSVAPATRDWAADDAANKRLGDAGEEFVVADEARRLQDEGHPDLAQQITWVAREQGDGLGYDVISFSAGGKRRLIEVKTTEGNASTPYYVTANELRVSTASPDEYWLYRVYNFGKPTRSILRVPGTLDAGFSHLEPLLYRATPRKGRAPRR